MHSPRLCNQSDTSIKRDLSRAKAFSKGQLPRRLLVSWSQAHHMGMTPFRWTCHISKLPYLFVRSIGSKRQLYGIPKTVHQVLWVSRPRPTSGDSHPIIRQGAIYQKGARVSHSEGSSSPITTSTRSQVSGHGHYNVQINVSFRKTPLWIHRARSQPTGAAYCCSSIFPSLNQSSQNVFTSPQPDSEHRRHSSPGTARPQQRKIPNVIQSIYFHVE